MPDNIITEPNTLMPLTSYVVSAYFSNHQVAPTELPALIATVHLTFEGIQNPPPNAPAEQFTPAVSARKSLGNPDKIISMIDGKPYSPLKRHLSSKGITPKEYRSRDNLPADYPMVAPGYSERRSVFAKAIGLGRRAVEGAMATAAEIVSEVLTTIDEPAGTAPSKPQAALMIRSRRCQVDPLNRLRHPSRPPRRRSRSGGGHLR